MRITTLFRLSCAQAENLCDKAQYSEAGFLERLRLKIHCTYCKTCREYTKTNSSLTSLFRKAGLRTCTEEEKDSYKRSLKEEFEKMGNP